MLFSIWKWWIIHCYICSIEGTRLMVHVDPSSFAIFVPATIDHWCWGLMRCNYNCLFFSFLRKCKAYLLLMLEFHALHFHLSYILTTCWWLDAARNALGIPWYAPPFLLDISCPALLSIISHLPLELRFTGINSFSSALHIAYCTRRTIWVTIVSIVIILTNQPNKQTISTKV